MIGFVDGRAHQGFANEEAPKGVEALKGVDVSEGYDGHTGRLVANVWAIPWASTHEMARVTQIT
jgi:hypothetical protein